MDERVKVTIDSGVAHVRMARPEKRNGLDLPMFNAIIAAGLALRDDRSVRAVVLSGEGKAFCAGLDFKSFMMMSGEDRNALLERKDAIANRAQRVAWIWQEIPVPVIAAIHGAAFGGGLQIALGADIRIAARDAQLSVMEIRYGLIPDMTASQTLFRLCRPDVAAELMFTGRIVDGVEAETLGLVTRVTDDPLAAATELATQIARQSPHAIRAGKRLLREASGLPVFDALTLETELQLELFSHPNQGEAVMASFEQRAPVFSDPD